MECFCLMNLERLSNFGDLQYARTRYETPWRYRPVIISRLVRQYKPWYKPLAKVIGKSHFRPQQRRNPLTDLITLDTYSYTPQATHHAKFNFDQTSWVVWAKSQFATVSGVFLPSFLFCFLRLAYKSCRRKNRHYSALIIIIIIIIAFLSRLRSWLQRRFRRVLRQGCAFWGLEYLIFTFLPIFTKNRQN